MTEDQGREYREDEQDEDVDEEEVGLYVHDTIIVDRGQQPVRIDKFLMDRLQRVTRNKVQGALRAGLITVDEKEVKPNFKVRPGMNVKVILPKPMPSDHLKAEDIPLDIRYEDDDIMVIYKPPGLVVHPGVGNYSGTLVNALAWHFKNSELPVMEGNSADRPGLVHRIDKDTSGLLVIVKKEDVMPEMARQFFDHSIERSYQAIVWGCPEQKTGTIIGNIARHPRFRMQMAVFDPEENIGKPAITHYTVLEDLYYVSLVECRLETGRTHQIRVHFSHIGHPLFNDDRYGGDRIRKGTPFTKYKTFIQNCFDMLPRQALHAKSLGFKHPRTGEKMFFESELPEDMNNVLSKWRNYVETRRSKLIADDEME